MKCPKFPAEKFPVIQNIFPVPRVGNFVQTTAAQPFLAGMPS
jgi:hypothetical protein